MLASDDGETPEKLIGGDSGKEIDDDFCRLFRMGCHEAQVDDSGRNRSQIPENQLPEVTVEREEHTLLLARGPQYFEVVGSGRKFRDVRSVVPFRTEPPDGCRRDVLVGEEPDQAAPRCSG